MRNRYHRVLIAGILGATVFLVGVPLATAQDKDYGDAPEGALAYPSFNGMGNFPTCLGGPAGFVRHGLGWAHFFSAGTQPVWDAEFDGNAGICPPPPYDLDECYADGDAGLVIPTSYTIVQNAVVACPNVGSPIPLGSSCNQTTITVNVTNGMPVIGYLNVLVDWDQNGMWGGSWQCGPNLFAPEHAVVDQVIPIGFSGPWTSPAFLVGSPGNVFVWMRVEISEFPVGSNWDGSGDFEDGESEDYLVNVLIPSTPIEERSWGAIKSTYR